MDDEWEVFIDVWWWSFDEVLIVLGSESYWNDIDDVSEVIIVVEVLLCLV